jgi:hypothetical protein
MPPEPTLEAEKLLWQGLTVLRCFARLNDSPHFEVPKGIHATKGKGGDHRSGSLDGALRRFTPIEAMPKWIQPFTYLNPIAHFATLARGVLVRGSGLDVVYGQLLALGFIATLLVGFSAWRFRGQMS